MNPGTSPDPSADGKGRSADLLKEGALDGVVVVRFAHAFEHGGGLERYLDDLDTSLLRRNAMTIIRMYVSRASEPMTEKIEALGKGRLIKVPLPLPLADSRQLASDKEPSGIILKNLFRDWVLYNPVIWSLLTRSYLAHWKLPRRSGQVVGAGSKTAEILKRHHVDLVMLHFFGGSDADEVAGEARRSGVPYALLNHFSNDRFLNLSIRKHAMFASGVSGVNGLDLPRYVRKGFCNLSDGIDTDFFTLEKSTLPPSAPALPLVLLPARIVRPKGQLDLVRASAAIRKESGMRFVVGLAGRVESSGFVTELRNEIARLGLVDDVLFLGELSVEELRNWYAASAVVAFPTYHHEGLGRVSLEAQAMHVPVVAYGTGGVAEGIDDGRTGYVVRKGDLAAMCRRLRELLGDRDKRREMGADGRAFIEQRFSLNALASRHEAFYRRVISSQNTDAS